MILRDIIQLTIMKLQIITPTGINSNSNVNRFQFTSANGMMEFLPGHAPMIAEIKKGFIHTEADDIACGNGVVKINDDTITVVCETTKQ